MTLRLISAPTTLPISVAEAKANGRIDNMEEDALIEGYIRAALAYAEKWCGLAFEAQTWEEVLDAFPTKEIELTWGPVASVTSVKYTDADGVEQTVDSADYVLDSVSRDAWVIPVSGFSWPTTMEVVNAVRVRFVAGAGTPADVRQAIMLLTEHFYENRAAAGEAMHSIPLGVEALLGLHRRQFV